MRLSFDPSGRAQPALPCLGAQRLAGELRAGFGPVPYITQWDGSPSQAHDCGPTVMAMVARARGLFPELTNPQLVQHMAQGRGLHVTPRGGTLKPGMIDMGQQIGVTVRELAADCPESIAGPLSRGRLIALMGDSCSLPGWENPDRHVGHWILLVGLNPDGSFRVRDPAHRRVTVLSWPQVQRFLAAMAAKGANPGIALEIA